MKLSAENLTPEENQVRLPFAETAEEFGNSSMIKRYVVKE